MMLPMPAPLLTVDDVAAHYRVKPSTVYKWAKKGLIPSVTIGGTLRFKPEVLDHQPQGAA